MRASRLAKLPLAHSFTFGCNDVLLLLCCFIGMAAMAILVHYFSKNAAGEFSAERVLFFVRACRYASSGELASRSVCADD